MHVGIVMRVALAHRVDHALRVLSAGGVVQKNQRCTAGRSPLQDWKVAPDRCHIDQWGLRRGHSKVHFK